MSSLRALDQHIWTAEVALREYGVRSALLLGDGRAIVWDTLSHPRDMRSYLALIANVDLVVAYSHADWDHIWGTAGLPQERTVVLGHRACLERFSTDVPVTLDQMQAAEPGQWDDVRLVAPTQVFDDQQVVELGSMSVVLHHLPCHTPDCCSASFQSGSCCLPGIRPRRRFRSCRKGASSTDGLPASSAGQPLRLEIDRL